MPLCEAHAQDKVGTVCKTTLAAAARSFQTSTPTSCEPKSIHSFEKVGAEIEVYATMYRCGPLFGEFVGCSAGFKIESEPELVKAHLRRLPAIHIIDESVSFRSIACSLEGIAFVWPTYILSICLLKRSKPARCTVASCASCPAAHPPSSPTHLPSSITSVPTSPHPLSTARHLRKKTVTHPTTKLRPHPLFVVQRRTRHPSRTRSRSLPRNGWKKRSSICTTYARKENTSRSLNDTIQA